MDQEVCDPSTTACELRRLVDVLSTPDWLDITSGLVVPIALGLATLAVAVFAIRTANRANNLAVELERGRVAREDQVARRETLPDVMNWVLHLFRAKGPNANPAREREAFGKVSDHRQRLGEETLLILTGWIRERVDKHFESQSPDDSFVVPYNDITDTAQRWADNPASIKQRRTLDLLNEVFDAVGSDDEEGRAWRQRNIDALLKRFEEEGGKS